MTNAGSSSVSLIDTQTQVSTLTIPTGEGPVSVAVTPVCTAEICDGRDNDCDGQIDEEGCGFWASCSAIALGSDWYFLDWWGTFYVAANPWVYHLQHHWLYPFGEDCDAGIVFWDAAMNDFWWTSAAVYPYVYRLSDGEWLWYLADSVNPRWFVVLSTQTWEQH